MLKIQSALACLLLVAALQTSRAQTVLTLEEALAAALANNYGIRLAKNDSVAGAIDASFADAAFLPRVNAAAGYPLATNYVNQNFPEGNTPDRQGWEIIRSPSASVNLAWTIFDGLKMFATRDRVEEIARLGELFVRSEVVNTTAQVTTTYFDIVRQKQQLRAIEEQMSINEERVKVADRKLSTGLGSKPELLQASVDLNAQKALQLQQQTLIAQRKEDLNLLAGLTLPADFDVADSIVFRTDLRLADIESSLDATNPDLILAQRNVGISQLALREREAERLPTVSLNSGYNFSSRTFDKAVNPFTPSSRSNGFNVGVSANIPILNNKLAMRNIEQAELDIEYSQLQAADLQTQLQADARNTFREYVYQQQALQWEEQNIRLARENVMIALERFRQGVSTNLELREAQISLEAAYNRLIAARYNAKVAEVELLRLRGDF